jgi:alpha-tubulin suppressor-like RCC1 family protein
METGFKFIQSDGRITDVDDMLVRRELFNDGTLWTWGSNIYGQLGDGTTVSKTSPVTTVAGGTNWKQVTCGYFRTAAIKSDGTLWTCGDNAAGQLGDGTTVGKSSPVTTVAGGTNWKQVACGVQHTAAIKTDGSLWTWGRNIFGNLGDGTIVNNSSPATTVSGGTNWKQVACGVFCTAAIKTDGTLWTWGRNDYGQLGDGTTVSKSIPATTVAGGTNWKQVACGSNHTAAIKTDGTLWTWGRNDSGALGGNFANKSSPVTTVSGGTNWKQVSAGFFYTAAIKTDGTLWTWGYNEYDQLGDGTTVDKASPVTTVAGGTNWKQVSAGFYQTAAIKTDGTLWTWGRNDTGQLGDGTTGRKSSPVTTAGGGTNWKQVSGGGFHTVAITDLSI